MNLCIEGDVYTFDDLINANATLMATIGNLQDFIAAHKSAHTNLVYDNGVLVRVTIIKNKIEVTYYIKEDIFEITLVVDYTPDVKIFDEIVSAELSKIIMMDVIPHYSN